MKRQPNSVWALNAIAKLTIAAGLALVSSMPAAAEAGKPPGAATTGTATIFRDCPQCPEMAAMPAGKFSMGSPSNERGRSAHEGPVQAITFAKPFAIGRYSVTFEEWDACVAGGGCNGYKPDDAGWGRERMPVINTSLKDAEAYVSWLSGRTGKAYRLPTEAEREYVTRAGTTTHFWWGGLPSATSANYNSSTSDIYGGQPGEPRRRTVRVDSFAANPWGLFNLHGNVWEWTADCWSKDLNGTPVDGSPRTIAECERFVVRGGAFSDFPRDIRAASRTSYGAASRLPSLGFRVARVLP